MKTFYKALTVVLLSAPLLTHAGNKIATGTMQVSFTVTESCNVQSATAQRPAVSCQLNTPYQVNRNADKAAAAPATTSTTAPAAIVNAAPLRTETGAQDWTIYF
ncbi:hypothetical protein Jab_1c08830 [Janthinobacterium sp. HH01]|uniref:hypothetical protein n=1 Tax=Janthinobacterium sp. HH01 TaxID=1198452 RepID=UPI0002AE82C6|nr:hypothetical protein [Janthinobacterium sp. HH01]ELX12289.1 hypothetical protein Jab_1c08830 [Janthinobacterium sp. HH01]